MTNKWVKAQKLKEWVENEKKIRSVCPDIQLGLETAYNGVLYKIDEFSVEDVYSDAIEGVQSELLEVKHQYENTVYTYEDTIRLMTKRTRRLSFAVAVYGLFTWGMVTYWTVRALIELV